MGVAFFLCLRPILEQVGVLMIPDKALGAWLPSAAHGIWSGFLSVRRRIRQTQGERTPKQIQKCNGVAPTRRRHSAGHRFRRQHFAILNNRLPDDFT